MYDLLKKAEYNRQNIEKYLGDDTDAFLANAEKRLEKYTEKWKLSDLSFMPTNTVNLLFACKSEAYGATVLKMCIPGPEVATEINCIRAYDGQGYIKLRDFSYEDDLLLLERILPGNQMWAITDYRVRARLMAQRINSLPFLECERGEYPTYRSWMERIHKKLTDMGGLDDVIFYLNEALCIYDELKRVYDRSCLLHGDMHQENLLLNQSGEYTIIDPKGVVDDPVMETARFLMNETPCAADKILEMVAIIAPIIGTPEKDILKSMYVDAALGNSWTLEEFFPTQEAFEESKNAALETCGFVYGLLQERKNLNIIKRQSTC